MANADGVVARMADAALDLLATVDGEQRGLLAWPFPSDDERRRWYYTPTDHGGLPLLGMRAGQQRMALKLVAAGLSRPGFVTVSTIMGLESVLDELEGWSAMWEGERGRDPGRYYVRIFGDPAADGGSWAWRFGGHHVSLNVTIVDGSVAGMTPCFLGADPASSPLLGPHPLRPLAGVEDLARDLVRSLDDEQRARAVLAPVAPMDTVGSNRPSLSEGDAPLPLPLVWRQQFEGELGDAMQRRHEASERRAGLQPEHTDAVRWSTEPKGVPASALRSDQRDALRALLDLYVGRVPDEVARREAAKYEGDRLLEHSFAWAGGVEPGEGHYYRVHGPRLVVEYDNTQSGANHVHSVLRDPAGDFGDPLLAHYRSAH